MFQACLRKYNDEDDMSWDSLASLYKQQSGEILRCAFKRLRKKLGITKDNIGKYENKEGINVLLLDIETSPLLCFTWGIYDQRIMPEAVVSDWFVIGWSAKWLFCSDVMSNILTSKEAINKDDSRIIKNIWQLIEKSDIIVGHNSNHFDLKKLNTRFILYGLDPPSYYQTIDTYQIARNNFAFSSNSMNFINNFLGIHQKIETNFDLWKKCYNGDNIALKTMEEYNRNDVLINEELYVKFRGWIKNHPNLNLYVNTDKSLCPNCGNTDLTWDKFYYTPMGKYKAFRCNKCKAVGRAKQNILSKEKKKNLIK